jgi:nucleotide-binding universal stress UspA family protein
MMYQHILLAVALQQDDGISGHALAARKVALSIARGSGAKLTVLIVYDYDSLDLSLSLPAEDLSRYRDTQRARIDETMEQKMKTFLYDMRLHRARELSVKIVIDNDTHSVEPLRFIRYGANQRRLKEPHVLNTLQ